MEDFRRQFLQETVETLRRLLIELQTAKTFSGSLKRDVFRVLHTVKGTAQTFGFTAASRLAHELENLTSDDKNSLLVLIEGIELLINSLSEKDFIIPCRFAEKIQIFAPHAAKNFDDSDFFPSDFPQSIFSQLSSQEKNILKTAIRDSKIISCLEIDFVLKNFAEELINFREFLFQSSEILATFPGSKNNPDGKIGFQILLAGEKDLPPIEDFGAQIVFQMLPKNLSGISGVFGQIAQHGKAVAGKLGKNVEFEFTANKLNISASNLKLVFDVLLHLVRNAIDHAFESAGTIKISIKNIEKGLRLTVADNGRGFDLERIKARAVEKNLFDGNQILTEKELIDMIFLPEFSTKSSVTEISGRGIGLDAVKQIVEQSGGKITVENQFGNGATFEIFLPND